MTSTTKKSKSSRSFQRKKRKRGSRSTASRNEVALAAVKDDLSRYLRLAADEEIVITRHGTPAGVLIGFKTEDDWFEYRLEHHPAFFRRIAEALQALADRRGVRLESIDA